MKARKEVVAIKVKEEIIKIVNLVFIERNLLLAEARGRKNIKKRKKSFKKGHGVFKN